MPSAERLAKELKRLADGAGERDIERSRQLREMARKQLEQSTPQQREELRRLAEQFARGGGVGKEPASPGSAAHRPFEPATAPVDARQPASVSGLERPPERTIAEWYSDKPASGASGSAPPSEAFRQAAQGAERAIEQQQVPGRYQDLVRRVFRRYSEQAAPK